MRSPKHVPRAALAPAMALASLVRASLALHELALAPSRASGSAELWPAIAAEEAGLCEAEEAGLCGG